VNWIFIKPKKKYQNFTDLLKVTVTLNASADK